ncbi:IS66 family transposase [Rhizobium leguminosarum]|uniref:IS66 family transposase n=1 Tax=Rhizobium leguminosarum TaxID=384 RepID=UPI0004874A56|nr:IS66 family transposase [Rhizobium leguminosarum]
MLDAFDLPDDIAALKAMLIAAQAREVRKDERIERLEKLVAAFKQAAFGRKSERADPEQFDLALEDLETAIAAVHAEDEADSAPGKPQSKPRAANRGSLPAHLPRVQEIIEPESLVCPCGGGLHYIGEDVSERLDVIPAQFRVIVTRRPKYACRACTDGVAQAPAPARLIHGGLPTEATIAHVLVSKYADHLPLYRQAQIMSRQGIDLDRSTLADWVGRAAFELRPVFDALIADLKRSTKLFMDETRAPVLDPGSRKTKTGYFWALARDDRPWGGGAPPGVALPMLQVVAGSMHNRLISPDRSGPDIRLAYCWAHARRKLVEITRTGSAPIAEDGVKRIAELYRIEADLRGLAPEARLAGRQDRSAPLIADMGTWLTHHCARVAGKSPLGDALAYIANYWDGLCKFLTDGRIEIDNNSVERTIRPIALNRKNALFAGHDVGAENWATIPSLIETCKLNDVDPFKYLTSTITAIVNDHKQSRIDELLPWNYPVGQYVPEGFSRP